MRRLALLLVTVVVVMGGCATFDPLEDTRIEAEVKARLVAEKDANLTRLGVVSNDGAVYLSGRVESDEQRALAARVAKGVRGVRRVVNSVEVGAAR
jgi:hyperosmotically inducible periplasmic protein